MAIYNADNSYHPMFETSGQHIKHHYKHESLGYIPVYVHLTYFKEKAHATIGWYTIPNYYGVGRHLTAVATDRPYQDFLLILSFRTAWKDFQ